MIELTKIHGEPLHYSSKIESQCLLNTQDVSEIAKNVVDSAESKFESGDNGSNTLEVTILGGNKNFERTMNIEPNDHLKNVKRAKVALEQIRTELLLEKIKIMISNEKISKQEFNLLIKFAMSKDDSFVYNSFPKGSIMTSTVDRWSKGLSAPIQSQRVLLASKLLKYIELEKGLS